jgi:hypothetical protein
VGRERDPYLTINCETGLPVLSPAHQHTSGHGLEMWLHAHVSKWLIPSLLRDIASSVTQVSGALGTTLLST